MFWLLEMTNVPSVLLLMLIYVDFYFVLDFAVSVPLAPVTTVRNGTTSFSFHCEFVFLNQTAMNGETEEISEWMYNNEPISENNTNNKR